MTKPEVWQRQLHGALQNMVHALKVGHGLQKAVESAAEEGEMPLAGEWQTLLHALRLGVPWEDALEQLAARIAIPEMRTFVTSVQVTRQSGGSLAQVLETLSETLEERLVLREKIKTLTAQGKASGMILAALPFVILGVLRFIVPDLVAPMFTTSIGQTLLAGMVVSVALGGLVIWKIVSVPVSAAGLPETLDLLTLLVQAGLDFQVAMERYLKYGEKNKIHEELFTVSCAMQTGSSRSDALRALAKRTRNSELRQTAKAIVQATELGSSLAPVFRAQSQLLRKTRALRAEKQAALAPLKLLFPLFVFIFPTIFVVLFGPVILTVMRGGKM